MYRGAKRKIAIIDFGNNDLKTIDHASDEQTGHARMAPVVEVWNRKYPGCINRSTSVEPLIRPRWSAYKPTWMYRKIMKVYSDLYTMKAEIEKLGGDFRSHPEAYSRKKQ